MDNVNIHLCKLTYRKPALEFEEKFFFSCSATRAENRGVPYRMCIEFCCYLLCYVNRTKGRASAVGIATRYELGRSGC
jgi:hypothetical protein